MPELRAAHARRLARRTDVLTIPFQSAAAWVTFMTGKNSGKHGVYMFQDYDALSYYLRGPHRQFALLLRPDDLRYRRADGRDGAAVRVPMTYPAWPINGIMVSGFPTPGTTPTRSTLLISSARSSSAVSTGRRRRTSGCSRSSSRWKSRRPDGPHVRSDQRIMRGEQSDLFMVVHRVPDPIHHFFMRYVDQRTPAYDADEAATLGRSDQPLLPQDGRGAGRNARPIWAQKTRSS